MSLFGNRRNQVVRRRGDRYQVVLEPRLRETTASLLDELDTLLEQPDDPTLHRLAPPAYTDDPDRDAEYQLLAGDELRTKRHQAIATTKDLLGRDEASEDELWSWLQSLNALRLVVGTRLDVSEDDIARRIEPDDPDAPLWAVYDFTTWLQASVIEALRN